MTVGQALSSSGLEAREARLLLAEATGFSQASVLAFQEKNLGEEAERRFTDFVSRRKQGEPVAYIVGHKEFYGLELAVNPAVLIPRPETELLVELVLREKPSSVLDLGTGSGAVALAIKKHLPLVRVSAVEASVAALVLAKRNATRHGLDIELLHGLWFAPVAGRRFELIVSNPPYVAAGDPHLPDLRFEPQSALVSGLDGLDDIREIVARAPAFLTPGGRLFLEHGQGQDGPVREILERAGLEEIRTWPDLAGIPRVSSGKVE